MGVQLPRSSGSPPDLPGSERAVGPSEIVNTAIHGSVEISPRPTSSDPVAWTGQEMTRDVNSSAVLVKGDS
jgi:hypothetical protein